MKTIPLPQLEKHKLFAKFQEGVRKDVERAFGVLQSVLSLFVGLHDNGSERVLGRSC